MKKINVSLFLCILLSTSVEASHTALQFRSFTPYVVTLLGLAPTFALLKHSWDKDQAFKQLEKVSQNRIVHIPEHKYTKSDFENDPYLKQNKIIANIHFRSRERYKSLWQGLAYTGIGITTLYWFNQFFTINRR